MGDSEDRPPSMTGRLGSAILAALGATVLVAGVVLAYLNGAVFDPNGFADRTLKAVDTKEVRARAAAEITRQIAPSAEGTPQAKAATDRLFDFPPFRGSLRFAAKATQSAVLDHSANDIQLALPDVGGELRDAVATTFPAIAQSVDPSADATVINTHGDGTVLSAVRAVASIAEAGLALIIIGAALGIGAVAFAMRRAATVMAFGAVLGFMSLVTIAALLIIRAALLGQFDDPSVHDAVAGIWSAFLDDLKGQLAILTGLGFAIVIGGAVGPRIMRSEAPPPERPYRGRAID